MFPHVRKGPMLYDVPFVYRHIRKEVQYIIDVSKRILSSNKVNVSERVFSLYHEVMHNATRIDIIGDHAITGNREVTVFGRVPSKSTIDTYDMFFVSIVWFVCPLKP